MTLTTQQVSQIKALTKHHIPYYDLQVEMVDHLASSIEEVMQQDCGVAFEKALQIAYSRFGSSGFKLLIRERRRSLVKQKWKMWFEALIGSFASYRILFIIALFTTSYYAANLWEKELNQLVMTLVITTYCLLSWLIKYFSGTKSKPLMLQTEPFKATVFDIVFPPMIFWIVAKVFIYTALGFAIAVTGFVLMFMATLAVNRKILQKAKQLYPEAFVKA